MRGTDGTSNYARDTGVTATAESSWSATYNSSKVIDGVNTTFYSSGSFRGHVAWLEVDLGKDIPMSSIASVSAGNSYGGAANRAQQVCFILRWLDASGNQLQYNRNVGNQPVYYYYPGEPGFETQPSSGWLQNHMRDFIGSLLGSVTLLVGH